MEVLVIRAGALGDTILTFPALDYIRNKHPQSRITFVGHPIFGQLATWRNSSDTTWADSHLSIESRELIPLFAGEKNSLGSFDAVYLWRNRFDSQLECALATITERLYIANASQVKETLHQSDFLLQGIASKHEIYTPQRFFISNLNSTEVRRVVIHPGAGSVKKRWPIEKFVRLGHLLQSDGAKVLFVAGPAEEALVAGIDFETIVCPTFHKMHETFSTTALYVGNDSGVTHFATACGITTIALFGPTNPDIWAPHGCLTIKGADSMDTIEVQDVLDLIYSTGFNKR